MLSIRQPYDDRRAPETNSGSVRDDRSDRGSVRDDRSDRGSVRDDRSDHGHKHRKPAVVIIRSFYDVDVRFHKPHRRY